MALHEWYLAAITITSILLVFGCAYIWNYRQSPGIRFYFVVNLLGLLINTTYYVITVTDSLEVAHLWIRVRFILLSVLPMIALIFITRFIRRPLWLTKRFEIIAWGIPILVIAAMLIPALWNTFFTHWTILRLDGYNVEDRSMGILYHIYVAHNTLFAGIVYYLILDYGLRVDSAWRRTVLWSVTPLALMAVGANVPFGLGPPPGLRPTPLMLSLVTISIGWVLLRHNTLSILPVAYDHVLNSVRDGVIVIQKGLIVRINPAAQRIIGKSDALILKHRLEQVLPLPDDFRAASPFEFTHNSLILEAESFPLYHHQRLVGQTLILRDLTAQRQAADEAFILKAERERSRLINQVLVKISNEFKTPMEILKESSADLQTDDREIRTTKATRMDAYIDDISRKMQDIRKLADQPLPTPPTIRVEIEPQTASMSDEGKTSS